jgi:hypothetical protein
MSIQQAAWKIEGSAAANREKWRMIRRLCWINARVMGGYKSNEETLWPIEGDAVQAVEADKRELWAKRLKELGKLKK